MNVIVVGGGNTGSHLAKILISASHTVYVIEERPAILEKLGQEISPENIISGDGSSPVILEKAGIQKAQVLVAATGSDETNLVITSLGRFEFNVPRVIARINNPKNAWIFTPDMGVDVALNQAELIGQLILEEMSMGDMMTLLKLRKGQYSLVEEKVDPEAVANGKAVSDLNLPRRCVLAAIIRKGELIIPRGDTLLQAADEVLAVVHTAELPKLAALLGPVNR